MRYDDILGLDYLKKHLQSTVNAGRIAHAQLFIGATGSGVLPLAIAYARNILCHNKEESCDIKMNDFNHPDLHFSYPVANNTRIKTKATSADFTREWRSFLRESPYGSLAQWSEVIEIEKKQSAISVHESTLIVKKLSLKAYEGGYKILLIWGADKVNNAASNKLLKLIEEPPNKTVIILIAEDEDAIINTIRSRCQVLHVPKLSSQAVTTGLQQLLNLEESKARILAKQADGDFFKATQLAKNAHEDIQFEEWFLKWIRAAFIAKTKKSSISDLIAWAENAAGLNRETQKRFLSYCIEFFRQALLLNYKADAAVFLTPVSQDFKLANLAPYVDGHQIYDILENLEQAIYHIDRNGNGKVIFTDLAISLTRIFHKAA